MVPHRRTGSTNAGNRPPEFTSDSAITRSVDENKAANSTVGPVVRAQDRDGDTLTYSLEGDDAATFDINDSTGQILTKSPLNYEGPCGDDNNDDVADESECTYSVTVKADDDRGGTDTIPVEISVGDLGEAPSAPEIPTVTSVADDVSTQNADESTTQLKVTWDETTNNGPRITSFEVQYRQSGRSYSPVTQADINMENKTVTITGLSDDTLYEVQVRAVNDEGIGSWSVTRQRIDQYCRQQLACI